jgi:hypothetical protein
MFLTLLVQQEQGTMVATILHQTSIIWLRHQCTPHPWCHMMHQGTVHGKVLCSSKIHHQDTKEPLAPQLGALILVQQVEVLIQIHAALCSGTLILVEGPTPWVTDQGVAHTHPTDVVGARTTTAAQVHGAEEGEGELSVFSTILEKTGGATSTSPWSMTHGRTCILLLATYWYPGHGVAPSPGFQNHSVKRRKHLLMAK